MQERPRPSEDRAGARVLPPRAMLVALGILPLAAAYAARAGGGGEPILAGLDSCVAVLESWGAGLYADGGRACEIALLAALAAAVAVAGWRARAGRDVPAAVPRVVAACLAGLGQASLMAERVTLGVALYAVAVLVALLSRPAPRPLLDPLSPRFEAGALLAVFALAVLACLYRLDVYPELFFDEEAYLVGARKGLGQLGSGPIRTTYFRDVYSLEEFRAAAIPFYLQVAAVALVERGIVATRLVSTLACAAALLAAAFVLRPRLGSRSVLWMLALGGVCPVFLAFARTGFFLGVSVLHGALGFAATLRVCERWDRRSALGLGAVLGASAYCYQLSWIVPVLSLGVLLANARSAGRRALVPGLCVAGAALAIAAPAPWLFGAGLKAVGERTFDNRAIWNTWLGANRDVRSFAIVVTRRELPSGELSQLRARLRAKNLRAKPLPGKPGHTRLWIVGPRGALAAALPALVAQDWEIAIDGTRRVTPWKRLGSMLAKLSYAPSLELDGHGFHSPLLNPLVVPFVVLGAVEALRRRRHAHMRALLVWVAGGALLPAVVGGVWPRRVVLALPFLHALAGLALFGLARSLATGRGRRAVAAACALYFGAVVCTDLHLYFRRWDKAFLPDARIDAPVASDTGRSRLHLMKVIRGLPPDEVILVPKLIIGLAAYLENVEGEVAGGRPVQRIFIERGARSAERVRAISCRRQLPFTWIGRNSQQHNEWFAALDADFVRESQLRGAYRVHRITRRTPGGCRAVDPRHP